MERKTLEPGIRLIIVFILTVIVSGGILTYFSINNISNLKELTEKKISEEQEAIAIRVSDHFKKKLEAAAKCFSAAVVADGLVDLKALIRIDSLELIRSPFVLGKENEFVWPWYLDHAVSSYNHVSSPFQQVFQEGEKAEFQLHNYKSAGILYRSSLKQGMNQTDSAMALNALGRISIKNHDYKQAFTQYSTITSSYHAALDHNGFPIVYYAIDNFLEFPDSILENEILDVIKSFLSKLKDGATPLCISSGELIAGILQWAEISKMKKVDLQLIRAFCHTIQDRLDFIHENGSDLRQLIGLQLSTDSSRMVAGFRMIQGNTARNNAAYLISPETDYTIGFSVEPNDIWSAIMKMDYSGPSNFQYLIELIERNGNEVGHSKKLSYSTDLSMMFPGHMVSASLKDMELVNTYIKRRSWIYGISLLLLLGAMFLGILLITRDILRERKLSQLRSQFVSQVTHELKTPLTSIHLFAESVLLDRVKDESVKKDYLRIILKETERLKRMISNILDFSRKETGKVEYKKERVNRSELVKSALKDLNYWMVELHYTIHKEVEDGLFTLGDPDALKQVVFNLLDNAIKYSDQQREISIRLYKDNDRIKLVVEDKGIGIPLNQLEAVFEKFYRVNVPKVQGIGGTGLGLTVVKEIVEAHHGDITVESEPDKGSIFKVLLISV